MRLNCLIVAMVFVGSIRCVAQTTEPSESVQTGLRVQQLRGSDAFVYGETEAPVGGAAEAIRKITEPIVAARDQGKLQLTGQLVIIMHGVTGEGGAPVKFRVGFPIKPGGTAPEGMQIGKLEPLRAATTVFSGSMKDIRQAYQQLYSELFAASLTPTDEIRETMAYWEGEDSANNVVIIQVGVK